MGLVLVWGFQTDCVRAGIDLISVWVFKIDLGFVCGPQIDWFSVSIGIDLGGRSWLDFSVGYRSFINKRGLGLKSHSALTEKLSVLPVTNEKKEVRNSNHTDVAFPVCLKCISISTQQPRPKPKPLKSRSKLCVYLHPGTSYFCSSFKWAAKSKIWPIRQWVWEPNSNPDLKVFWEIFEEMDQQLKALSVSRHYSTCADEGRERWFFFSR